MEERLSFLHLFVELSLSYTSPLLRGSELGGPVRSHPGLNKPTGPVKPARSGSGLPDRFDRKPVKFKIKFKITCSTGSERRTGRFDRFTGRFDW